MKMNKIRALMALRQEAQRDLATLLGITTQSVGFKLNGHTQFKVDEIEKIAEHYKVKVGYFFED